MRFKVLIIQFKKLLSNLFIFMDRSEEVDYMLQRIDIKLHEPEQ